MNRGDGRSREAAEIVRYKKAAAVGRLLLEELDGPMDPIAIEQYLSKPRRELVRERDSVRLSLRGEIAKFCRNNFEDIEPEDLAELYDVLAEHDSNWFVPLLQFERDYGRCKPTVLRGAPLHSTLRISPWGFQPDFPEHHLLRDIAVSVNEAIDIEEHRLTRYRTKGWREIKDRTNRPEIADLLRHRDNAYRNCLLSCFNLVQAYINGVAWGYVQTHDISGMSHNDQNLLTESKGFVSIVDKLIKVPRLVTQKDTAPLHQTRDPLKSFIEIVKPYRDAIVHASPFAAPERFGGYSKLEKLYKLDLRTVRQSVENVLALISAIHQFVDGSDELPQWFLPRRDDGRFTFEP